ncbi:hypothetical protein [Devosia sp. A16]|uniref:hypothetical protein n=1 Tax=Devosia sp. A16 TaxID=1736675 RepID=UPI0012E2A10A|nr:hypothetical protein [Devosia sp. A16]
MIILDTNVISDAIAAVPTPRVLEWLAAQPIGDLWTTAVTAAEHGHRHHTQRQQRIVIAPTPGDDPFGRLLDHRLAEGVFDGDRKGLRQGRGRGEQQGKRNEKSAKHEMPPAN